MTILDDLILTMRGRERLSPRRVFAICIAQQKRKELCDELHTAMARINKQVNLPYEAKPTVRLYGALIGTIR